MSEIRFTTDNIKDFQNGLAYVKRSRDNRRQPTVRITLPDGTSTALCTSTYNYNMSYEMQCIVAQRIADLWNSQR